MTSLVAFVERIWVQEFIAGLRLRVCSINHLRLLADCETWGG